jgi:hypothetical protein
MRAISATDPIPAWSRRGEETVQLSLTVILNPKVIFPLLSLERYYE